MALIFKRTDVENFLAPFVKPKILFPNETKCDANGSPGFKCHDGECIESELICDGRPPQCKDRSDREYCENKLSCNEPKYKQCLDFKECFIPDLKRRKYKVFENHRYFSKLTYREKFWISDMIF